MIEHGANPGLISHFTKQALLDIAEQALADKKFAGAAGGEDRAPRQGAWSSTTWPTQLGVKVIHCSERDTQITDQPKEVDEFVNTWSVEGFREEGTTTAEMGWGTHEKELPALAFEHPDGPQEPDLPGAHGHEHVRRELGAAGPPHRRHGRPPRRGVHHHREAHRVGRTARRSTGPTVHYAYCPCDRAIASLHELRGYDYKLQPRIRIMTDEITSGADILGALVMGHPYQSWWCGSRSRHRGVAPPGAAPERHDDAGGHLRRRRLHVDAREPAQGLCVPDDLPHDYVLDISKPYLGKFISVAVGLEPAEALLQRLPRLQPASARHVRSLAVQELPDHRRDWTSMDEKTLLQRWPRRTARRSSSWTTRCCGRTTRSSASTCRACRSTTRSRPTAPRTSCRRSTRREPASTSPAWPSS